MREAVIVSAVRTPTGKFLGVLKGFGAAELGAMVVREAICRARVDPEIVDECIMGNVVSAGLGQNPARQAALNGGLRAMLPPSPLIRWVGWGWTGGFRPSRASA